MVKKNFFQAFTYFCKLIHVHVNNISASIYSTCKYKMPIKICFWINKNWCMKKLVFKCMHTCKSQVRLVLQRFFTVSLFQEIIKNKNDLLKNGTVWNFKHTFFRWLCVFKGSLEWMLASLLFFYRLWWNGRYAIWWIGFLIFKTWS